VFTFSGFKKISKCLLLKRVSAVDKQQREREREITHKIYILVPLTK
jgi:hypothetical protein